MFFKIKETIRNTMICMLMAANNDLEKDAYLDFVPENYRKKHIVNSSIITMYYSDEHRMFFRECRRHKSLKEYIFDSIDDYFENICEYEKKKELKAEILKCISKKNNYIKLVNITSVFDSQLIDILSGKYCNYSEVGLDCFSKFENNEEFIAFIQYICCIVNSQKINGYLKNGKYENFNANKQLATYRLACLFGIGRMIPAVREISFEENGKQMVGTMMEEASGSPPSDILPEERKRYDKSSFLKDLTTLEYFDAICYQLDHRLDNYYVTQNEDKIIENVVAFDNDAARTFFVSPNFPRKTYSDATCILDNDGTVKRPYIDKEFADRLLNLTKKDIKSAVGKYLSVFQLYCLNKRIEKLKKAIKKTTEQRNDFLVTDWNLVCDDSISSSKWGKTYFELYLNDTLMLDRKKQFEEMKKQ